MKGIFAIFVIMLVAYVTNFVKFTNCDFESSYKCEAIHGIGVFVPPSAIVTVWFDSDES